MRYMLLIDADETVSGSMPDQEKHAIFRQYGEFTQSLRNSGAFVAGDPLQRANTATTVRDKNGRTVTTDGPFAETKEQLGGFYLIEARDLNEAIQVAAKIPSARIGSVEVRPVVDFSQQPQ